MFNNSVKFLNDEIEFNHVPSTPLFSLGVSVVTQGVHYLQKSAVGFDKDLRPLVKRHLNGDWGNVCEGDKILNDISIENNSRILSSYVFNDEDVWIITEGDRSVTTILLPNKY